MVRMPRTGIRRGALALASLVVALCFPGTAAEMGLWQRIGTAYLTYLLFQAVVLAFLFTAHFGWCYEAVEKYWPSHDDPWDLADVLAASGRNFLMVGMALTGVVRLGDSVQFRWLEMTQASHMFLMCYSVWNFLHMFVLVVTKQPKRDRNFMLCHHVVSITCYSYGLWTGRMQYWGCLCGACEVSNIPLNMLYLFKKVTIRGKKLQDCVPNVIFVFNGVLLWLSYLIFRMMLFTYWYYQFFKDITSNYELTVQKCNAFELIVYPVVTAFMFGLSAKWFIRITDGLVNAITGKKEKEATKTD